jgi:hypothetical protein
MYGPRRENRSPVGMARMPAPGCERETMNQTRWIVSRLHPLMPLMVVGVGDSSSGLGRTAGALSAPRIASTLTS